MEDYQSNISDDVDEVDEVSDVVSDDKDGSIEDNSSSVGDVVVNNEPLIDLDKVEDSSVGDDKASNVGSVDSNDKSVEDVKNKYESRNYTDKNHLDLPYYNNTNYPLAVKNQLLTADYNESESILLKYHQFVVKEFFTRNPTQRGLLICHSMGQGKTRLAVAVTDTYRKIDKRRKILVLSAKSLEANFKKEIVAYTGHTEESIDANYKFISLNSSNMFKQMSNVGKTKEEIDMEKKLGEFVEYGKSSLENSLLIIDEAHNLFNSATNGSMNALALYDLIMETTNIKLIFMSGTPIINGPFELVPCFNMLRGYIYVKDSLRLGGDSSVGDSSIEIDYSDDAQVNKVDMQVNDNVSRSSSKVRGTNTRLRTKNRNDERVPLFSEDIDEFYNYFVNRETKTIKNKDKFTNRIYGLVSYYGDLYFTSSKEKPGFPKELDTIVEKIPMSSFQFARYMSARILELEESKKVYKNNKARFSSAKGEGTTYRVKTRQISNYAIPEYALGPVRGAKAREKFIDRISEKDLQNLDEFSPKMAKVLSNIENHKKQLGMVYSQFVSGEGIAIFARVLLTQGYRDYSDGVTTKLDEYVSDGVSGGIVGVSNSIDNYVGGSGSTSKSVPTFAILSGEISPEERAKIIATFNLPENADGSLIQLLLLSGAVAEGIDLKRIRHVHVMEPFWNFARINQVKTRAIRYKSHVDLPESEQNVQVYIYLSDYPKNYPPKKITEDTTDVDLYKKSIDNMHVIDSFMLALAESSIDCSVHHGKLPAEVQARISCKLCSPTNGQLFHPILHKDMNLPSTCKPYSEKQVSVDEIILPDSDEKYYFKKNTDGKITLYHFNKKLNGYAPMQRTHPKYGEVMFAIVSNM
jgi:hypothetical protein